MGVSHLGLFSAVEIKRCAQGVRGASGARKFPGCRCAKCARGVSGAASAPSVRGKLCGPWERAAGAPGGNKWARCAPSVRGASLDTFVRQVCADTAAPGVRGNSGGLFPLNPPY